MSTELKEKDTMPSIKEENKTENKRKFNLII